MNTNSMPAKRWLWLTGPLLIFFIFFTIGKGNTPAPEEWLMVTRGTLTKEAEVTGKIVAEKSAMLSFVRSGTIIRVNTLSGESIRKGQIIAQLEITSLTVEKAEVQARVDRAQARLAQLERGARPEEIALKTAERDRAQYALLDAQATLKSTVTNSFEKIDSALRNSIDRMFMNPHSVQPLFNLASISNEFEISKMRAELEFILVAWREKAETNSYGDDFKRELIVANNNVNKFQIFLNTLGFSFNLINPNTTVTAETLAMHRANITAGRLAVIDVRRDLLSAENSIHTANSNLLVAENSLALVSAGGSKEDIDAARADLAEANASVERIEIQIAHSDLIAPFSGRLVRNDFKIGETVVAGESKAIAYGNGVLVIEAMVPEVDAGSVTVGQMSSITIDAFPTEIFSGTIRSVELAETIIDGVSNYKTTIQFDKLDARFRSGLTANLTIITLEKKDALLIPQIAVHENDLGAFVTIKSADGNKEIKIELGLRGSNGLVEVKGGVAEGVAVMNISKK